MLTEAWGKVEALILWISLISAIQSYSALFRFPALTFFILYIVIPSSTFIIPAYISDEKEEKTVK